MRATQRLRNSSCHWPMTSCEHSLPRGSRKRSRDKLWKRQRSCMKATCGCSVQRIRINLGTTAGTSQDCATCEGCPFSGQPAHFAKFRDCRSETSGIRLLLRAPKGSALIKTYHEQQSINIESAEQLRRRAIVPKDLPRYAIQL